MRYMIMIYGDEQAWSTMSDGERAESFAAFMQYNKDLAASGALRAGDQLTPSRGAKTVRPKAGQLVTTDGPFAETREQLGGYYIVETDTEAEALALAVRCPAVWGGAVEVRALMPANF